MAADVPVQQQQEAAVNPCCSVWREKYTNLQERRKVLRQAVKALTQRLDEIQALNVSLNKSCEEERTRAQSEKEGKEKELAARVSLENEISTLKSQISVLHQKGSAHNNKGNKAQAKVLHDRVSKAEKEIDQLKMLLEKEKARADSEKKNAEAERKSAAEAWKLVKAEKIKADEERKLANIEGKKAEECWLQLEAFKKEADEAKSKLVSQTLKFEEEKRKLEAEIQKVNQEWKHAVSDMSEVEEQRELAETNAKKVMEERCHFKNLSQQLEDARRTIEQLQKADGEYRLQLEAFKKDADDAKLRLVAETLKLEEANRKLEAEKDRLIKENKRANSEMAKAKEHRKLAEANEKKAMEEKSFAENLFRQLEDARRTIDALQKADEERKHANIGGKKAEDYLLQLEALKKEADDAKSKLVSETLKFEEANRELEAERLKVINEKKCAYSEITKAEEQRKLAEANGMKVVEEKSRAENLSWQLEDARRTIEVLQKADKERKHANIEVNIAEEYQLHLESLMKEADDAKSKFISETLKFEGAKRELEAERLKVTKEKERADLEMAKAEEQRKLAEVNRKLAMKEKSRADQLCYQLKEDGDKIETLQIQIRELLSSRKLVEASAILHEKEIKSETAKVKLLQKELKLEKKRFKHAKQVAMLEKSRNTILQQELHCLKLDFVHISCRLDVLDKCFSPSVDGTEDTEKAGDLAHLLSPKLKRELHGLEPFQRCTQNDGCSDKVMDASDSLRQTHHCIAPLLLIPGGNCTESISGIDSKLESLDGGSNRKLLQSSAINSSSGSFSDGQLVGSQERGAFLIAPEKLLEENFNAQPTASNMSGEVTKSQHNENIAVVAEGSVRSSQSVDVVGRVSGRGRKRRMLDVIKSVEFLYLEGKKLHLQMEGKLSVLHDMLNRKVDKHSEEPKYMEPDMQGGSYDKHEMFHKKRKVSREEKEILPHLSCMNEAEKTKTISNEVVNDANACKHASSPANDLMGDSFGNVVESMEGLEEVANGDYMKLLDLDNAVDEECYRRAMEMPLSPTLPQIGCPDANIFNMDKFESLLDASLLKGLSDDKEIFGPHSFDAIGVEITSNNFKHNACETSPNKLLHENEGLVDSFDILGNGFRNPVGAEKAFNGQTRDSRVEFDMSNIRSSRDELGSAHDNIPTYCVRFSDINDSSSISRIFCMTRAFMACCSLDTQRECMVRNMLHALKEESKISSKEKACAFFTLLLLNFSTCSLGKSRSFLDRDFVHCLDSFADEIKAVMSDAEARSLFAEICSLDVLLGLIEDFLIGGSVMIYADVSSGTLNDCESRMNILLDGVNINLSSKSASDEQLVAGSIILGSICAATDHMGFICEASYNLLRMRRWNTAVVLNILHVFAYLGGKKFFSLKKYSLTLTVLKSIVSFLEGGNYTVASAPSFLSSADAVRGKFCSCANCPFSEDALSVDNVASMLLKNLQSCVPLEAMHQHLMESANLLNSSDLFCNGIAMQSSSHEELLSALDMSNDASCRIKRVPMPATGATVSSSFMNGTLCNLSDNLALVELLACNMSWEWTCDKIIPQLLEMLERAKLDNFAIPVVILLGQLGRLGVSAGGYEDKGVKILSRQLCGFLWRDTTIRAGLLVQIATVTALLGLMSLDFDEIICGNLKLPATASQSAFTDLIRKWFSLLSKEQQALSIRLLQLDVATNGDDHSVE